MLNYLYIDNAQYIYWGRTIYVEQILDDQNNPINDNCIVLGITFAMQTLFHKFVNKFCVIYAILHHFQRILCEFERIVCQLE